MRQRWDLFEGPFTEHHLRSIEDVAERLVSAGNNDPAAFRDLVRKASARVPSESAKLIDTVAQIMVANEAAVPIKPMPVVEDHLEPDDDAVAGILRQIRKLKDDARDCADRMGDREPPVVFGPFGALDIAAGDTVVVEKGSPVFSMNPHGIERAPSAIEVAINRITPGHVDRYGGSRFPRIVEPEIWWSDPHGGWYWTAVDSIRTLGAPRPTPSDGTDRADADHIEPAPGA